MASPGENLSLDVSPVNNSDSDRKTNPGHLCLKKKDPNHNSMPVYVKLNEKSLSTSYLTPPAPPLQIPSKAVPIITVTTRYLSRLYGFVMSFP